MLIIFRDKSKLNNKKKNKQSSMKFTSKKKILQKISSSRNDEKFIYITSKIIINQFEK